jgi:hypothetical protein
VVNRVFTTRTKNLFLPFRFQKRDHGLVQDFAMSASTKFAVKNYASNSTERGAGGE